MAGGVRALFTRMFGGSAPAPVAPVTVANGSEPDPGPTDPEKQSLEEIPHPSPPPAAFVPEGGTAYCCRFGQSSHGAREEDLMPGVIPTHPLDVQDALTHYEREGAIINSACMF